MNALQSYSSDDESGNEAPTHKARKSGDPGTNYDDVGMDISEDSDEELPSAHQPREKSSAKPTGNNTSRHQESSSASRSSEHPHVTSSESSKNSNEVKEGQRSSLQERLLGLACGGSQRMLPGDDRASARDRREKSRSKSREREIGRSSQSSRDHSSRSHQAREQTSQGHSGRNRDSRKGREEDRKRKDDERRGRRSRSRSRSRDRRRSRSRSRERRSRSRSRSRSRERRRRSRSHERGKRPVDIRKEAQQKLAALKAANPDLTAAELLKRSMEAQVVEVQKQTGITLPSYYNPAAMNPMKFAEQERKKKLLWGNKNKTPLSPGPGIQSGPTQPTQGMNPVIAGNNLGPKFPFPLTARPPSLGMTHSGPTNSSSISGGSSGSSSSSSSSSSNSGGQAALWANTRFSNDKDGKMAEKFRRLMGVKNQGEVPAAPAKETSSGETSSKDKGIDILQKQETMFSSMERQYEMARIATHTHKGFGLGFTSQSFIPK